MKLLFCRSCHDIIALLPTLTRRCICGQCAGRYTDNVNAEVEGDCIVLGIGNKSLVHAMREHAKHGDLDTGLGRRFDAFILPDGAPTVTRKGKS